jgi:hypothetical protein
MQGRYAIVRSTIYLRNAMCWSGQKCWRLPYTTTYMQRCYRNATCNIQRNVLVYKSLITAGLLLLGLIIPKVAIVPQDDAVGILLGHIVPKVAIVPQDDAAIVPLDASSITPQDVSL